MVYLEHSSKTFWRCEKTSARTVIISFGKCGSDGRTLKKTDFKNASEAQEYVEKQQTSKRKIGYFHATDPNSKRGKGTKRKKSGGGGGTTQKNTTSTSTSSTISKKAGLSGYSAPNLHNGQDAVIDCGLSGLDSSLASRGKVHDIFHAKLAIIDQSKNQDKYYIIQVVVDENAKKQKRGKRGKNNKSTKFYLFSRWGRTGTGGEAKLEGPWDDEDLAEKEFVKLFKSKTGVAFSKAVPGQVPKKGKYEYLSDGGADDGSAKWYYYLENDPLGKANGWYEYDTNNRAETEELFSQFNASGNASRFSTRLVHSETSGFTYRLDLEQMTQTNTQSGTTRPIGRSTNGKPPQKKKNNTRKATSTSTPTPTTAKPKTTATKAKKTTTKVTKKVTAKFAATKSRPTAVRASTTATTTMSKVAGAVDPAVSFRLRNGSVYGEYDTMLNQTNLAFNNNKFYKIQLVETSSGVTLFTKWGRVGEAGSTQEVGPMDSDKAIAAFKKKFRSKTLNDWDDRSNFEAVSGKYTMVEIESDEDAADAMSSRVGAVASAAADGGGRPLKMLPCSLDVKTKSLVDLIFDADMFKSAMKAMNLDPAKLPLGALSKTQIKRGFDALEDIEEEIDNGANHSRLVQLTSTFYTVIPHAFGRSRGTVLTTKDMVNEKYEMLNTLTDIEAAQEMQKRIKKMNAEADDEEAVEHPSDMNYKQLCSDITLLTDADEDLDIIKTFLKNTQGGGYHNMKLRDVWRLDRHNESKRFAAHSNLTNRKLLWHGTNVAVVAAILKSGLRIMPHSGGRVGRGIYLADQHEKSAWYVSAMKGTIIMFLVEAALGKQHEILRDDSSLTCAPSGFDSVLAKGSSAPSGDEDVEIEIDGKSVTVPQGKPVKVKSAQSSSFAHNEFLIYKESQHRIRYILAFDGK